MWVKPNSADMAWMQDRIAEARLRVVVERSYPLDRVKDALAASEAGRTRGKIVIAAMT